MRVEHVLTKSSISSRKNELSLKQGFSDSFNQAYKSNTKEELEKYINEIKQKGNRITITQNYVDVLGYKKLIKCYLESVVDYMYSLNKDNSFWETGYFTTVETVNEKLEELTKNMLHEQQENIDVASTIDNIQGLLVDIYK